MAEKKAKKVLSARIFLWLRLMFLRPVCASASNRSTTVARGGQLRCRFPLLVFVSLLPAILLLLVVPVAAAQGLIFLDLTGLQRSGLDASSELPDNDVIPRATLFYSGELSDLRFLAEFAANDKKAHFGRVKAGWQINPSNLLWLGRTHNPASYWRNQFHHGGWLQPSISRPGIAEFEVPGGVLPAHSTGVMYETGASVRGDVGLALVATFGFTSVLAQDGLEVPELVNDDYGMHGTSTAMRLSYRFDEISGGNEAGLLVSLNHIPSDMTPSYEVEQGVFGAFVNWYIGDLRLVSEMFAVHSDVLDSTFVSNSADVFYNAYIMLDYSLDNRWNMYTRLEDTSGEAGNQYLTHFNNFISQRGMVGVRYSFNHNNLVKFELDHTERSSGDKYGQVAMQWSFVYP